MDNTYILHPANFPTLLSEITDPPKKLFIKGSLPKPDTKVLCVVGSRKFSSYGEDVCKKLIAGLRGYNISIVSGLAIGIDSIAHRAALEAGLHTVAFPGSGLNEKVLYPAQHRKLAEEILYAGGALVSELEMDQMSTPWTFPQRNRLMAGISQATLVIEGKQPSGTLLTSRLALDYNRDVGAVPGHIYYDGAEGPNNLIHDGAKMIRNPEDILEMLGFSRPDTHQGALPLATVSRYNSLGENERRIISLLQIEPRSKDFITRELGLGTSITNIILSTLEIEGLIKENGGMIRIMI